MLYTIHVTMASFFEGLLAKCGTYFHSIMTVNSEPPSHGLYLAPRVLYDSSVSCHLSKDCYACLACSVSFHPSNVLSTPPTSNVGTTIANKTLRLVAVEP